MVAGIVFFAFGLETTLHDVGGTVSVVCALVVAYEAIRYRTHRVQIRHPELTG